MNDSQAERVEQLIDYIMQNCLWQFHSRAWDRERQNREILTKTREILCGESLERPEDLLDRCHWVDGMALAVAYRDSFPWIDSLDKPSIAALFQALRERLDHLTITGSLNLELTDQHY